MSSPSANDLLASARELSELARTHADDGEKRGQLHAGLVAALKSAGLFGMLVPRELGGLELDVATFVAAIEAVARRGRWSGRMVRHDCRDNRCNGRPTAPRGA